MNGFIPRYVTLLEYKIRLSASRYAFFTVPEDLSNKEGERLGQVLAAIAGAYEDQPQQTPTDDVPVFRGTCTCEHPDYDHAFGSCDPNCNCQAGWYRTPYTEALKDARDIKETSR